LRVKGIWRSGRGKGGEQTKGTLSPEYQTMKKKSQGTLDRRGEQAIVEKKKRKKKTTRETKRNFGVPPPKGKDEPRKKGGGTAKKKSGRTGDLNESEQGKDPPCPGGKGRDPFGGGKGWGRKRACTVKGTKMALKRRDEPIWGCVERRGRGKKGGGSERGKKAD